MRASGLVGGVWEVVREARRCGWDTCGEREGGKGGGGERTGGCEEARGVACGRMGELGVSSRAERAFSAFGRILPMRDGRRLLRAGVAGV